MAKAPTPEAPAPEKSLYRLHRGFWDGRALHEAGDLLRFIPGTQPKTAELVSEQEKPELIAAPTPAPDEGDDD